MPINIPYPSEESIIESMLPPRQSMIGRSRRRFCKNVFSDVLIESSVLLFMLGYRKGPFRHYSLISGGLTYIVFWAVSRYSARTKINLSSIRDCHLVLAFLVGFFCGLSYFILAVQLRISLFPIVLVVVDLLFFIIILLALGRFLQTLFRTNPTATDSTTVPVFSLLLFISFIFFFIHYNLYFWRRIIKQDWKSGPFLSDSISEDFLTSTINLCLYYFAVDFLTENAD